MRAVLDQSIRKGFICLYRSSANFVRAEPCYDAAIFSVFVIGKIVYPKAFSLTSICKVFPLTGQIYVVDNWCDGFWLMVVAVIG